MMRAVSLKAVLVSLVSVVFVGNSVVKSADIPGIDSQVCNTTSYPFKCPNGNCIPFRFVCDGDNDCGDKFDEKFCDPFNCHPFAFQCLNGRCIRSTKFCDRSDNCGDNSDEQFCNVRIAAECPRDWTLCPIGARCIPSKWICNGIQDCPDKTEERNCENKTAATPVKTAEKSPDYTASKAELMSWLLGRRKLSSRADRWGSQVHRTAVALHLADISTFATRDGVGQEIRYELTTQLLQRLGRGKRMSSQELALYIHALLVSCMDPKDFYGENLVQELRKRVDASQNYTNPFLVLVLCNARDAMTDKDVEKVTSAYDSQHRPFWTDYQALASMALSCISSRGGGYVDERTLKDMLQELKKRQFRNGTVDNYRTTALVTQALFMYHSYQKDFDLNSAMKVLTDGLNGSRSLLNVYYILPVLSRKSLLNVSSDHCIKESVSEEEALQKTLEVTGETVTVQYSVWMGDEINLARTWRLRMKNNSTIYDAIETVAKIDSRQKVEYNVVEGKPYVTALNGKEDDPEMGMFWFVYLKDLSSDKGPKIVEESPVDIKMKSNQEVILWYKRGSWSDQSLLQKPVTSS